MIDAMIDATSTLYSNHESPRTTFNVFSNVNEGNEINNNFSFVSKTPDAPLSQRNISEI